MSQTGICFAPFPRNELHILEFNMRQQLKQNQILVEKAVKQLIADMAHGDIPIVTDVKVSFLPLVFFFVLFLEKCIHSCVCYVYIRHYN